MKALPVSMGEVMSRTTLEVKVEITGIRWFHFRLWLGTRILKLAARVLGCGIEIKGPS